MQKQKPLILSRRASWLILLAIIVLTILLRYNLLDVPLERDEGEYAYAGQLILQGIPPYQQMYNMKLPGIYAIYAGILAIFGQTPSAIHLGLLLFNIATIIVLFLVGKQIAGPASGLVSSASFAALSVGQAVQGVFANAEHFLILPAIGGLLFLITGLEKNRLWHLFVSGFLVGSAFIIKQHGAAFILLGMSCILLYKWHNKKTTVRHMTQECALFTIGAIIPYGLTCFIFWQIGVFKNFWFWTVDYARAYTSLVSLDSAWSQLRLQIITIIGAAPLLWLLSGLGLTSLAWDKRIRQKSYFIVPFVLFSILAICPGFYFRPHYFVMLLPVVALLCGIAFNAGENLFLRDNKNTVRYGIPGTIIIVCLAVTIYQQRTFLFQLSPDQASRATYWPNPFPESLQIAKYIREHSSRDDRIAIIGSEPQIYFYSQRQSASGYIYMYALMENHEFAREMQQEMIREVENATPKFLVFVRINYSWLQNEKSPTTVFDWYKEYGATHYKRVGLIDIFSDTTLYHWQPDFVPWPPRSPYWIEVLERKTNPEVRSQNEKATG